MRRSKSGSEGAVGTRGGAGTATVDPAEVTVTLAPMRRRHVPGVVAHEKAVYAQPWTSTLFLSELARPETRSYVIARAGAVLVGHCGVLFVEEEGHLTTVVVSPDHQGLGIATRMLLYQFAHAVARGTEAMTLEVSVANTRAQELYRRFGFVPAGLRRGYYAATGEDALVMWAHDIASDAARRRRAAIGASLPNPTAYDNLDVPEGDASPDRVAEPSEARFGSPTVTDESAQGGVEP